MAGAGNRSAEERREMAKKGEALPDGSYPCGTRDEIAKAVQAVGRGNAPTSTVRAHIVKNARRLGAMDLIPDSWGARASIVHVRASATREWLLGRR